MLAAGSCRTQAVLLGRNGLLRMRSILFVAGIALGMAITALWIAFLAFEFFKLLASLF
jgi:hypothetical protein